MGGGGGGGGGRGGGQIHKVNGIHLMIFIPLFDILLLIHGLTKVCPEFEEVI